MSIIYYLYWTIMRNIKKLKGYVEDFETHKQKINNDILTDVRLAKALQLQIFKELKVDLEYVFNHTFFAKNPIYKITLKTLDEETGPTREKIRQTADEFIASMNKTEQEYIDRLEELKKWDITP